MSYMDLTPVLVSQLRAEGVRVDMVESPNFTFVNPRSGDIEPRQVKSRVAGTDKMVEQIVHHVRQEGAVRVMLLECFSDDGGQTCKARYELV